MAKENETTEGKQPEMKQPEKETKERASSREWIGYGLAALLLAVLTAFACGFFAADQNIQSALDPEMLMEQFADGQYVPDGIDPLAYVNKQTQEDTDLRALFLEEAKTQVDAQVEKDAEAGLRERLSGFPEEFIASALLSDAFIKEKDSSKEYAFKQAEKKIAERFDKAQEGVVQKRESDRTVVSVIYILTLLVLGAALIPVIKWTVERKGGLFGMPLLTILCGTAVGNLLGFALAKEMVLQHYRSRYVLTLGQEGSVLTILGITALLPVGLLLLTSYFIFSVLKEREVVKGDGSF
ncbi:MAG: hypothetical protein K6E75_00080 [Lachnospiraceae bacterium]|nr:hypothetical protein [Lachnospiraceae bacterium]